MTNDPIPCAFARCKRPAVVALGYHYLDETPVDSSLVTCRRHSVALPRIGINQPDGSVRIAYHRSTMPAYS